MDLELSSVKKKFKDKKFAANVSRDIILECEKIGLSLDEYLQLAIDALRKIAPEIGGVIVFRYSHVSQLVKEHIHSRVYIFSIQADIYLISLIDVTTNHS